MSETMTIEEFTQAFYQDCVWSYGPQPMTLDDARYNLRELRAEGYPVPKDITPRRYALLWNLLYLHDMREVATV